MAVERPLGDRPTREQLKARRLYRRAFRRARNPLRISLRSLSWTLLLTLLAAIAAIALVISLRGEPGPPPQALIIAVTALPAGSLATKAIETVAPDTRVILAAETPASLALTGPPIATVLITETPLPLAVGVMAQVVGVGNDELNVRNLPNRNNSQVLFRAQAGARLEIIGGPQAADDFIWWRVRDPQFQVEGWAAGTYLQTIAANAGG